MNRSITIAGTMTVDEICFMEKFPSESELVTIESKHRTLGGLVPNCALALAQIDRELPINVVGVIGNDEKGSFIEDRFSQYKNINTKHIKKLGETPFTYAMESRQNNTRTFFNFKGSSVNFDEFTIDFSVLETELLHIGYLLLLDALDSPDLSYGTKMARVLKEAKSKGIETSIDVITEDSKRYKEIIPPSLPYTDYCIINELEAGKITGINLREQNNVLRINQISKVLYKLKEMGVNKWVIIHSPEGGFGYDGQDYYSVPSLSLTGEQIKATVGAGDAFASGVLYGIYKKKTILEALKLGISSATSSLMNDQSILGIAPFEQLIQLYEEMPKNERLNII